MRSCWRIPIANRRITAQCFHLSLAFEIGHGWSDQDFVIEDIAKNMGQL
jgi:hypothetical protein